MKKILFMLPILAMLMSCGGNVKTHTGIEANKDSVCLKDSTIQDRSVHNVSGVALDGAMNSILLKTFSGDSLNFGYPELPTDKRVGWMIGDTVTISYIEVNGMDSVVSMRMGCF